LAAGAVAALCTCATPRIDCEAVRFTTTTHMTNRLKSVFVVRELRGRLTLRDESSPGDWVAPEIELTFELRGPRGYSARVPISADGSFRLVGLRSGTYCFRVSSPYLQAYEGTIMIDPLAQPDSVIEIRIAPGV
jgi:hypothetical protein